MIRQAEANQMPIIVLCGRPYHLDPEINHGIDKLITSLGACIVTEDVISNKSRETKYNRFESMDISRQTVCCGRIYL